MFFLLSDVLVCFSFHQLSCELKFVSNEVSLISKSMSSKSIKFNMDGKIYDICVTMKLQLNKL